MQLMTPGKLAEKARTDDSLETPKIGTELMTPSKLMIPGKPEIEPLVFRDCAVTGHADDWVAIVRYHMIYWPIYYISILW